MRVVVAMGAALAAAVLGFLAFARQDVTLTALAVVFLLVMLVAVVGPRKRDRAAAAATPLPPLETYPAQADAPVAAPPGENVETETGALSAAEPAAPAIAADAPGIICEETESPAVALSKSPAVRTPFSVQPSVVLMSLFDATASCYDALSAHLWLEDGSSETLRLLSVFGSRQPESTVVALADPVLGAAARTGSAVFACLGVKGTHDREADVWRYAVPVGTPEMRGVAGVDIATHEDIPPAQSLNEIAAVLRGSLTAAIAIHVAHAEMEAAIQLLQAAQQLSTGMAKRDVIDEALERAMRLAGATTGSVMLPDPDTGELRIVAARGLPDEVVAETSVARGEGIAGVVFDSGAPALIEDLPGAHGASRHGVHTSASVPIGDAEGNLGVLNVGSPEFPARSMDMYLRALTILAAQTALAIRVSEGLERSWNAYIENLEAFAIALEASDPYMSGTSKRIADLCVECATRLSEPVEDVVALRVAALLHDVGMGLVTGSVGSSGRPLSTIDRGLVRAHPKVAADVLATVPSLEHLAPIVRHHHERYDGTGYDAGLSGSDIPRGSRILAVVDAYVSMTSPRAYREPMQPAEALAELREASGTQFDPDVVAAFGSLLEDVPGLER